MCHAKLDGKYKTGMDVLPRPDPDGVRRTRPRQPAAPGAAALDEQPQASVIRASWLSPSSSFSLPEIGDQLLAA